MNAIIFLKGIPKTALLNKPETRVAQCIDKEILIGKNSNIDIGIDIDKENFEKLIRY